MAKAGVGVCENGICTKTQWNWQKTLDVSELATADHIKLS